MKELLLILALAGLAGCSIADGTQGSTVSTGAAKEDRSTTPDKESISNLHRNIVAVDLQEFATPSRIVVTLKGVGWSESDILYGFAVDATSVLKKMGKKKLIPAGQGVTFILRVDTEFGGQTQPKNVVHIAVSQPVVQTVTTGADISAESLLNSATTEFNGRMGRELTQRFCSDDKYQGASGVFRTVEFCQSALGNQDTPSS
jgi:hypothetical protein